MRYSCQSEYEMAMSRFAPFVPVESVVSVSDEDGIELYVETLN